MIVTQVVLRLLISVISIRKTIEKLSGPSNKMILNMPKTVLVHLVQVKRMKTGAVPQAVTIKKKKMLKSK